MTSRCLALNRLMKSERLVIVLLRGSPCRAPGPENSASFAALRDAMADSGLLMGPPASPYIWRDETRMLGWLASMQRQNGGWHGAIPRQLAAPLQACAASLSANGIRLDYRAVARCHSAAISPSIGGGETKA